MMGHPVLQASIFKFISLTTLLKVVLIVNNLFKEKE